MAITAIIAGVTAVVTAVSNDIKVNKASREYFSTLDPKKFVDNTYALALQVSDNRIIVANRVNEAIKENEAMKNRIELNEQGEYDLTFSKVILYIGVGVGVGYGGNYLYNAIKKRKNGS